MVVRFRESHFQFGGSCLADTHVLLFSSASDSDRTNNLSVNNDRNPAVQNRQFSAVRCCSMLDRQIEAAIFLRRSSENRPGLLAHCGSSDCLGDRSIHARRTGSVHPGECQQMTTVVNHSDVLRDAQGGCAPSRREKHALCARKGEFGLAANYKFGTVSARRPYGCHQQTVNPRYLSMIDSLSSWT